MFSREATKILGLGLLAALLVTTVLLFTIRRASADGAIVTRLDNGCVVPGTPIGAPAILGDVQDVQTPSGNEKFTCQGQIAPGFEPDRTVHFIGGCTGFSGAGEARVVYTPSGRMSGTCQIR